MTWQPSLLSLSISLSFSVSPYLSLFVHRGEPRRESGIASSTLRVQEGDHSLIKCTYLTVPQPTSLGTSKNLERVPTSLLTFSQTRTQIKYKDSQFYWTRQTLLPAHHRHAAWALSRLLLGNRSTSLPRLLQPVLKPATVLQPHPCPSCIALENCLFVSGKYHTDSKSI
jgi:hypothetical protein